MPEKYVQTQIPLLLYRRLILKCAKRTLKIKEGIKEAIEDYTREIKLESD